MKKLVLLSLFVSCFLSAHAQQETWDALNELYNHDWNREGVEYYTGLSVDELYFKTDRQGSNRYLHPVFIDYSKDFKITLNVEKCTNAYTFLINGSPGGADGVNIELTPQRIHIYQSMLAGNYDLYDKKNKKILLDQPHTLIVGMKDGEHYVTLKQNDLEMKLYKGHFSVVRRNFSIGLLIDQTLPDIPIELKIENIKATYTKSNAIDFILNPEDCFGHKEKLPGEISSSEHELSAIVSTDGKKLYFVRKSLNYKAPRETIMTVDIENNEYSNLTESPINYLDQNYLINISPDNSRAYISGVFDDYKQTGTGISYRDRNPDGTWTSPTEIKIRGFETVNTEISNYISSDGQIVIASLEKEDGQGKEDLYVSLRDENGEFGDLINLGPKINTTESEIAPYLGPDNQTLYFAVESNKQGFGSSDIYVSKRLDNTWQKWSKPVNMGFRINSADWEAYMSVPASGDYFYFISTNDRSGADADIYRIELKSKEVRPEPVILLSGKVLDAKDSLPLHSKIVYKNLETNEVIGEAYSDSLTGAYQLVLPYKSTYSIYAQTVGYYPKRDTVNMLNLSGYRAQHRDLYLQKMVLGSAISLNNIFFETGKSKLLQISYDELNELVSILELNNSIHLNINGYTDNVGDRNANLKLSENRAKSVMEYLTSKGIDADRLIYKGYGDANPLNDNSTPEKRQANRRVEFVITKQ